MAFRAPGRTAGVPVTATEVKSTVLLDNVVIEQFLERLSILPDVAVKPRPSGRGYEATICGLFPVPSKTYRLCFLFAPVL